jgi:hypothetical protein
VDVYEALVAARKLFDELELHDWSIALDNAKNRCGQTRYGLKRVTLSRHFVAMNPWSRVRQTVLHEAAHVFAGPGQGHNRLWQAYAIQLGIPPRACNEAAMPEPRWAVICPKCGVITRRHRRPSSTAMHRTCGSVVRFEEGSRAS